MEEGSQFPGGERFFLKSMRMTNNQYLIKEDMKYKDKTKEQLIKE